MIVVFASLLWLLIGLAAGAWATRRSLGFFPIRMPSNTQRLANAQTDLKLTEISNTRAKARFESQAIEIEGEAAMSKLRLEIARERPLALEASSENVIGKYDWADLFNDARIAKGWTLKTVCSEIRALGGAQAQVTPQRLGLIERGAPPRIDELPSLAKALGLVYEPPRIGLAQKEAQA